FHRPLRSTPFPTRRSSDLGSEAAVLIGVAISISLSRQEREQRDVVLSFPCFHKKRAGDHVRVGMQVQQQIEILERRENPGQRHRSEEHTSELQSQSNLVCR